MKTPYLKLTRMANTEWLFVPSYDRFRLLLFQIVLRHENLGPRVTQFRVQFTQVRSTFQVCAGCRGTLDCRLETVLLTSRCLVLVTTSEYAVTAFRCLVRVRNLFEVIIASKLGCLS